MASPPPPPRLHSAPINFLSDLLAAGSCSSMSSHPLSIHIMICCSLGSRALLCCWLQVRARFVERFSMGAPFAGGEVRGPAIRDMSDRCVGMLYKTSALFAPAPS
jgi:hypothetical protein